MQVLVIIGIVIAALLGIIVLFVLTLVITHKIRLATEKSKIIPNGQLVKVNGNNMHVYIEGENKDAPLLVFLSGSGTSAPVYDFKPLWSLLTDKYRIAVVERLGYGYSDVADSPRDTDTVLSETRAALHQLGEKGPYVLLPHSMSGLESLYWAKKYPHEVAGIIGIDMGLPEFYVSNEEMKTQVAKLKANLPFLRMGLHRLPSIQKANGISPERYLSYLSPKEAEQLKLLFISKLLNKAMINELDPIFDNAKFVADAGVPDVPMLLLVATKPMPGSKQDMTAWVESQQAFAQKHNAKVQLFDTGHYLHHAEAEAMAAAIIEFIEDSIV